jgi:hypothetical protein
MKYRSPGSATPPVRGRVDSESNRAPRAVTSLSLESAGSPSAQVTVHDLTGRKVTGPWDGSLDPGRRTLVWDGRDDDGARLPDGLYFIRAQADGKTLSRSVIRVRRDASVCAVEASTQGGRTRPEPLRLPHASSACARDRAGAANRGRAPPKSPRKAPCSEDPNLLQYFRLGGGIP